jgi:lipoprotein-anchoring transpeptidase ErfK/SrfK
MSGFSQKARCHAAATFGLLVLVACTVGVIEGNAPQTSSVSYEKEPFVVLTVKRSQFAPEMRPTRVYQLQSEPAGTIIVDIAAKQLYIVEGSTSALRYGVAIGPAGRAWKGTATVGRKVNWPTWYPADEMKKAGPGLPSSLPPGQENPLGARALYLYQNGRDTLFRIHGTSEPWTIGTETSRGGIRMVNEDVIALYDKVGTGARVVVR